MYYKLKTSFLEEALSDALDEDSFDLSILESSSQTESRLSSSFSEISTPDVSALTSESSIILQNSSSDALHLSIDNSYQGNSSNQTEFDAVDVSTLNANAWSRGAKSTSTSDGNSSGSKFKTAMSDKLFRNSSFLKRNPRKSLSRNSLSSNHSSQSLLSPSQKESFPDLETILSQKSKQQTEENVESQPTPPAIKAVSTNIINNIDEQWLNRCSKANNMDHMDADSTENQRQIAENPKTFGLSNINASALASYERTQPVQEVAAKSMLSFDMSNMNLKSQGSLVGHVSTEADQIAGDDEEIANSEDESDMNLSRQIRSIRTSIKRKYNEIDRGLPTPIPAKTSSNSTVNSVKNNAKEIQEKPMTVKKTKTREKIIPRRQPVDETNKSELKVAKAAVVPRKSSRNVNKTTTYKEIQMSDLKSDNEEESDPFAGDDSEDDPNFSDVQDKGKSRYAKGSSSSDSSEDEQAKPVKETKKTVNTRKRVARVKIVAKPQIKAPRKAKTQAKTIATADANSSADEAPKESPDDYLLEFGMVNIKSVPRIPIAELEQNTMEFTKYAYSVTVPEKTGETTVGTNVTTAKPLSAKNSIAKEKLEKKIASGSLNENYVRLNLRKKVFVRGKKTMNFSRYKKKLWKSKKAAALSGPDMDMGGCDGGILTCFQCGLPGHFAQNCKVKSKYFQLIIYIKDE